MSTLEIEDLRRRYIKAQSALFEAKLRSALHSDDLLSIAQEVALAEHEAAQASMYEEAGVWDYTPWGEEQLAAVEAREARLIESGVSRDDFWHLDPLDFAEKYRVNVAVNALLAPIQSPGNVSLIAGELAARRSQIPKTRWRKA